VTALALATAFGVGLLTSRVLEGEASAQRKGGAASTVYVPSEGMAFRTLDGRVFARLSYDAHGGFLELYDEHERAAGSLHGAGLTAGLGAQPSTTAPHGVGAQAPEATQGLPDLGY
jgi:hypothetical protein